MWFLPSLNRIERLKEAFRSMVDTGMSTPGVLIADDSYSDVELPKDWIRVDFGVTSYADRMRRAFEEYPNLEWYGLHQDDVICRTMNWDTELVSTAMEHGIASCNDLRKAPKRIGAIQVFRGDVVRAMGNFFPDGFHHSFVDDIWETVGRECGIWKCRMDVIVEAMHPFFGKAKMDKTYEISYQHNEKDKKRYQEWMRYEKDSTITRVLAAI